MSPIETGGQLNLLRSPLANDSPAPAAWRLRILLFALWLALVAWLISGHVFWRDEVRAFSLALSGSNVLDMLRNVHGEGHPALWYLILRVGHDLFPMRQVLPVAGALIGIAAMALLAFRSPFRIGVVALILFSFFGAFEYLVVSRNYGIAALVMFAIAALYRRIRNSLWLGLLIALLCNTNVPSCILAAGFLLFRFVEMLGERSTLNRREWLVFCGNAALALAGALLCFVTVFPTVNDQAVSSNLADIGIGKMVAGLLDTEAGFSHFGFGIWFSHLGRGFWSPLDLMLLLASLLGLVRRPAAIIAAIAALIALKLFFYLIYPSYYRHEALFIVYLIALYWMVARGAGGRWRRDGKWLDHLQLAGTCVFIALLALQSVRLVKPVQQQIAGTPYSRSSEVTQLLQKPELRGAIIMADPDTMLEPFPFYGDNPLWFLRQQGFGQVVRLSRSDRRFLTLDEVVSDAQRLHRQTGRAIVFLDHHGLQAATPDHYVTMFKDETIIDPASVTRFRSSMRLVASLRPAGTDEEYEVYAYPR